MRSLVLLLLCTVSWTAIAATDVRSVPIEDWVIKVPGDYRVRSSRASDFKVTYFEAPDFVIMIGFYVGSPSEAAASEPAGLKKEADQIGGEKVAWWVWEEKVKDGDVMFRAQVVLAGKQPRPRGQEEIRFFLVAQNSAGLDKARDIVRTLEKRPNQPPEPTR